MAVLGLGAVMGRARGDDTQVPEFRLGEVVVTGSAPRIVDEATTVQEVTAADIAAKGARTLDEALDLLPGLRLVAFGRAAVTAEREAGVARRMRGPGIESPVMRTGFPGAADPAPKAPAKPETKAPAKPKPRARASRAAPALAGEPSTRAGI